MQKHPKRVAILRTAAIKLPPQKKTCELPFATANFQTDEFFDIKNWGNFCQIF
jgi:hypothetical protein